MRIGEIIIRAIINEDGLAFARTAEMLQVCCGVTRRDFEALAINTATTAGIFCDKALVAYLMRGLT